MYSKQIDVKKLRVIKKNQFHTFDHITNPTSHQHKIYIKKNISAI